ncbi:MAG: hypothetical protein P8103_14750 [Candidatus Thiodiazotropha sp.]
MPGDRKTTRGGPSSRPQGSQFDEARHFAGQRWVNIGLRSGHLVGVAGVGGGVLFGLDDSLWQFYWWLTLATGVALSALYFWSSTLWPFQLKGMAILFKVGLLGIGMVWPSWQAELFIVVILVSALVAHAPGKLRGYQFIKRTAGTPKRLP